MDILTLFLSFFFLSAVAFRYLIPILPTHKPHPERWSKDRVRDCGGIIFLPLYILAYILSGNSLSLLVGTIAIWILGLVDDLRDLSPYTKLIVQSSIAILLVISGWHFGYSWLLLICSFFWIVGVTNSINMMDNMDGLAGGLAAMAFLFMGSDFSVLLMAIILGFLVFNLPKAKVYMGDCGVYIVGLNLACLSIELGMIKAGTLLSIFLIDTGFVIVNRGLRGKNPLYGGADHLSHLLAGKIGGPVTIFCFFLAFLAINIIFF